MKKITLANYLISMILLISLVSIGNAQQENSNWYFGNQAGLNFNDGTSPPTTLTNSSMTSQRSAASVSDSSGNLLFYTDGINVWNNVHQIMPNATGLFGNNEIAQSVLIVPDPNNASKYYIFTNRGNVMGLSGIYYSIIDMSLDGGLGDIDVTQKNIILQGVGTYNKNLTVILNSNDNSYWVVIFGSGDGIVSDTFYTYKVDALGVNLANQATFTFNLNENPDNATGQMKISPDGQSLALIHNTVGAGRNGEFEEAQSLFVFDFDGATGAISQLNDSFSLNDNLYSYGLEFSPDSNLLYVSTTNRLSDGRPIGRIHQIQHRGMGQPSILIYEDPDPIYSLQLGIDGKIYSVNYSSQFVGTINNPNIIDTGANYVYDNITLSSSSLTYDLPQLVPFIFLNEITKKAKKPIIMGNPFKEELKFKFKFIQTYTIEFYNSNGALSKGVVYDDMTNRKPFPVDTSDLETGTYYLIVRDGQSQVWYETVLKIE